MHPQVDGGSVELRVWGVLHSRTASWVNNADATPGRRVWYNYWDTRLTYEKSYRARLNYVHQDPVNHRLVAVANQYPWCSAAWFERTATPAKSIGYESSTISSERAAFVPFGVRRSHAAFFSECGGPTPLCFGVRRSHAAFPFGVRRSHLNIARKSWH